MMFTDQRWADFVPCFFEHHILKDPGYNVAYWNLHARRLTADGGGYVVDGEPLASSTSAASTPGTPYLLSKHQGDQPRILLSERPVLARVCRRVPGRRSTARHRAAIGARRTGGAPSRQGWRSRPRMRRLYRDGLDGRRAKATAPSRPTRSTRRTRARSSSG